jgi:hypothetical protein
MLGALQVAGQMCGAVDVHRKAPEHEVFEDRGDKAPFDQDRAAITHDLIGIVADVLPPSSGQRLVSMAAGGRWHCPAAAE